MLTYSIGELIDKLCVVHLKIWHLEEEIERLRNLGEEELENIEPLLNKVVSLNKLRVKIVSSIDEFLTEEAIPYIKR